MTGRGAGGGASRGSMFSISPLRILSLATRSTRHLHPSLSGDGARYLEGVKFIGGPWTEETRAGTFARFFEAHAGLEKSAFLAKVRAAHLVFGMNADLDPRAWDQGIVVRLDKKN